MALQDAGHIDSTRELHSFCEVASPIIGPSSGAPPDSGKYALTLRVLAWAGRSVRITQNEESEPRDTRSKQVSAVEPISRRKEEYSSEKAI
jgi:hypothetical protein